GVQTCALPILSRNLAAPVIKALKSGQPPINLKTDLSNYTAITYLAWITYLFLQNNPSRQYVYKFASFNEKRSIPLNFVFIFPIVCHSPVSAHRLVRRCPIRDVHPLGSV